MAGDFHKWFHDMKSCLAAIQMGTQLLSETENRAEQDRVCELIYTKVSDATQLLETLKKETLNDC